MKGMHAIVTGGGRGIGLAIAQALSGLGALVTLIGRELAALERAQQQMYDESFVATADVADPAQVAAAFAKARERFGPVRILVNNAGQAETAPFGKISIEMWRRLIDVNLTGTFLCTQAALPDMLAANAGRVVNIASMASLHGLRYGAAYAASKHAVLGLTRSVALEVADRGITVNAVCPGYVETDMMQRGIANVVGRTGKSAQEARAFFASQNPQKRVIQPSEVAAAVIWLCSEGAAGVNGAAIPISGGQ
jgi:NAD(P)-dependent dehydrogenase (short-subunit alcohol dehydrogenase family)